MTESSLRIISTSTRPSPTYRAPHIYLAFPARLMEGRQSLTDQQAREAAREAGIPEERWKDCSETVLMTTRGGTRYDTTFREGTVRGKSQGLSSPPTTGN